MKRMILLICVAGLTTSLSQAEMQITEYMYNGNGSDGKNEFIEFTNVGDTVVDMTGWTYDDGDGSSLDQPATDLSAFGVVQPGESVIVTETTAEKFVLEWSLPTSVKVIGNNDNNLGYKDGSGDIIFLYNSTGMLVDSLITKLYTNSVTANPSSLAALAETTDTDWVFSTTGDAYGSYASLAGDVGNPGIFTVPEPASFAVFLSGLAGMALAGCHKRRFFRHKTPFMGRSFIS
jgi:predicted extracellular nuclease